MFISKISIKNYRWIKNQELCFDKYNTLVWRNDCGKSTIINAIKLFFGNEKVFEKDFNCYLSPRENIEICVEISDFPRDLLKNFLLKWEKEDGVEEILSDYLDNWILKLTRIWEYKSWSEIDAKIIFLDVLDFVDKSIYGLKSSDLKKIEKELWVELPVDWTGNNSDIERQSYIRNFLIDKWYERDTKKIECKFWEIKEILPVIELLKADQSIETTTTEFKWTFSSDVKSIIKEEKEKNASSTLSWIEQQISEKIFQEAEIIKQCMQEHLSDLDWLRITPTFSWEKWVEITNVDIKLKSDEDYIPLENKGSGYRRLFMVWRLRYLANKKESENVIYLVEEPETFLHPSAQEEMLNSLISLSENNQVFITSHSPIFVGATKSNAITLCTRNGVDLIYSQDWDKDEKFLIRISKELWVKPLHDISDSYKAIVFVEWFNDAEFLKIASEKLSKNFHNLVEKDVIAIIDGWWESLKNFINIKFFEQQNKAMFLIIDSDEFDKSDVSLSDDVKKSLSKKVADNIALQTKFNSKSNAKCFILKKKNIDTYYHPMAIERKLCLPKWELWYVIFDDVFDTKNLLSDLKKKNPHSQIPKKNWIDLFKFMTEEEWKAVSSWELENIFDEIEKSIW